MQHKDLLNILQINKIPKEVDSSPALHNLIAFVGSSVFDGASDWFSGLSNYVVFKLFYLSTVVKKIRASKKCKASCLESTSTNAEMQ
jgi:hypothetical protein